MTVPSPAHYRFPLLVAVAALISLLSPQPAKSQEAGCCESCGKNCARLVPKTIMVPVMITETVKKPKVVQKTEMREVTYTVFKRVPEKRKFTRETCYLDQEVKTKTITEEHCHLVQNPVVREYDAKTPVQEMRTKTVQRQICTECGPACVEETCTCPVNVEASHPSSTTCQEPDLVFSKTKHDISYCVLTPKQHVEVCAEDTVYKLVPIEKTCQVEVCVPEIIKVPCEVTVCKKYPKTIWCCEACGRNRHGR